MKKIVGIRKTSFLAQDGNEVKGYNLYYVSLMNPEDSNSIGWYPNKSKFISEFTYNKLIEKLAPLDHDILDKPFNDFIYNERGSIRDILD